MWGKSCPNLNGLFRVCENLTFADLRYNTYEPQGWPPWGGAPSQCTPSPVCESVVLGTIIHFAETLGSAWPRWPLLHEPLDSELAASDGVDYMEEEAALLCSSQVMRHYLFIHAFLLVSLLCSSIHA